MGKIDGYPPALTTRGCADAAHRQAAEAILAHRTGPTRERCRVRNGSQAGRDTVRRRGIGFAFPPVHTPTSAEATRSGNHPGTEERT